MTRNSKELEDFTAYCNSHPEERFWQALRNWSGASNIWFADQDQKLVIKDTYYWEGKTE